MSTRAPRCPVRPVRAQTTCPLHARLAGQRRVLTVTPRQPATSAHLRTGRLTRCANRLVTKLLAASVTVWNRRRCLRLAQRGQCPSDKPVGDHGGSLTCPPGVSSIRGSHVSGMRSSKQRFASSWPNCGFAQWSWARYRTNGNEPPHVSPSRHTAVIDRDSSKPAYCFPMGSENSASKAGSGNPGRTYRK